jgi:hypothetical protein
VVKVESDEVALVDPAVEFTIKWYVVPAVRFAMLMLWEVT